MSADNTAYLAFLAVAMLLPVMALVSRRLPLKSTIQMALIWILIFAAGTMLVTLLGPALGLKLNNG